MSEKDLAEMFECPGSGNKGAIYLIKLVKNHFIVKQSCPPDGKRLFRIPVRLEDQSVPYFRDSVFRCFKCGQGIKVAHVKHSGPWSLIYLSCPTHGNKRHKIWSSVYKEISNEVAAK